MKRYRISTISAACSIVIAAIPISANATDLKHSIGYAANSGPTLAAEAMAAYSKSKGGPNIKVFPMTLLNIRETPPGVRDRVVDMGFNAHGIFSEYPNANLPAEFGMLATNAVPSSDEYWPAATMAGVITEYNLLHCPECIEEFKKEKQLYLSGLSSSSYMLHCSQKISTLEEAKGKQFRTPSGYWARWTTAIGAVSVNMSVNEAFAALSQGIVQCVVINATDLVTARLIDVTKATTIGVPGSVFSAAAVATINTAAWGALNVTERKVLLEAAAFGNASHTIGYAKQQVEALNLAKSKGIKIYEASDDLKNATKAFVGNVRNVIIKEYTDVHKVKNVEAKVQVIESLIEKWLKLTKGVQTAEELHKIYLTEIYSKLDATAYGK